MAKLNDMSAASSQGIGNDGVLRFIDEINAIRARSGNRFRFQPCKVRQGVIGMQEHYAVPRPMSAHAASERYSA